VLRAAIARFIRKPTAIEVARRRWSICSISWTVSVGKPRSADGAVVAAAGVQIHQLPCEEGDRKDKLIVLSTPNGAVSGQAGQSWN